MPEPSIAFFEQFNAKYLDPEQVAAGYVYSHQLEELSGPYHAVLVGPRGSGKTTLLKMLQPGALDAWKSRRAESFRKKIDYSGVFIASDISWSRQLSALGYGRLPEDIHRSLVLSCFTTHVLQAVVEAMILRTEPNAKYRAVSMPPGGAERVSREITDALRLDTPIASLLSVKQALRSRLSDLRLLANRGSIAPADEFRYQLARTEWLHLDCLDSCSNVTSLFNDAAGENKARWALLFDELETAPDWIVEQLFIALRVSNPRLYLKLAISPVSPTACNALMSIDGPADGHDYRLIRLWYADRMEARGFCDAVWESLTKKAGLKVSARDALGPSAFEPASPSELRHRNPYARGEYWTEIFRELARKDKTFAAFLHAKSIDLEHIGETSQQAKDATLRKAAPVAAVRNFFLHEDNRGQVAPKSRKTSALYAGAESIFAISEGNPRWLIGLLTPMIAYLIQTNEKRVPVSVQAEEIDNAAERLLALLRTIPLPREAEKNEALGLNGMVRNIGVALHDDLMKRNFAIDPRLSFVVDRGTPKHIVDLLAAGLNRGALILVSDAPSRAVVGELSDSVVRLSYLLAAKYGLPLRRGKKTSLAGLLNSKQLEKNLSQLDITGF
jgi:hypothetical protein